MTSSARPRNGLLPVLIPSPSSADEPPVNRQHPEQPDRHHPAEATIADRVNLLFHLIRDPDTGRPYTNAAVSRAAGVSDVAIGQLRNGHTQPRAELVSELAQFFNVTPNHILGWTQHTSEDLPADEQWPHWLPAPVRAAAARVTTAGGRAHLARAIQLATEQIELDSRHDQGEAAGA